MRTLPPGPPTPSSASRTSARPDVVDLRDTRGPRGQASTARSHAERLAIGDPAATQRGVGSWLSQHPLSPYYLLLGTSLLLLLLGVVMVLSSSSVLSLRIYGSSFTLAGRQAMFAAAGVLLMHIMSRRSVTFYRRIAYPALLFALVTLVVVLVIGVQVAGQRNWIAISGPFRFQPSEFAKIALVIWCADLLARKDALLDQWKHLLIPLVPVTAVVLGLVVLEGDLGTTLVIIPIVAAMLFVAGAPLRLFVALTAVVAAGVLALSIAAPYRVERFTSWWNHSSDALGSGWQALHGQYALASGGWFGLGLGASREKWGSLPEAHTDFIFAVVGEELGLLGTLTVLGLFAVLVAVAVRMARTTTDPFVRLATTGIAAWIVTQALVNVGAVLSLLPITGVPLPLLSYGGSSLLPLLMSLGMLMAFARAEGARRAQVASDESRDAGVRREGMAAPRRRGVR